MKKFLVVLSTAALVFSMGTTGAFAAVTGRGQHYVDANGDRICDHYYGCTMNDTEGKGNNFIDADGDGICDHYSEGNCLGRGMGKRNGMRGGCIR